MILWALFQEQSSLCLLLNYRYEAGAMVLVQTTGRKPFLRGRNLLHWRSYDEYLPRINDEHDALAGLDIYFS